MMTEYQSQPIWRLLKSCDSAFLSYFDGDRLRSRPLKRVQSSFDGTLWFLLSRTELESTSLRPGDSVGVTFRDPANTRLISISGVAGMVEDPWLIRKFTQLADHHINSPDFSTDKLILLEIYVLLVDAHFLSDGSTTLLFDLRDRTRRLSGS